MDKPTSTVYQFLAGQLLAMENCKKAGNDEWFWKHKERATTVIYEQLPSGSGFDNGTKMDFDASTSEKLVFTTEFHHMTNGSYDGWTYHRIVVKPSLVFGITMTISGRDRNDIKDGIHQTFEVCLKQIVKE